MKILTFCLKYSSSAHVGHVTPSWF